MTLSRVSSPASTGGAGAFFEQHVAAYWLAQLLVQSIPPVLHDCIVEEVHFQTEGLGWNTDDFLVMGKNGLGNRRKLAGQVKRTFTVSATDEECEKAIQDFWKDFKNSQQFSQVDDRFALVTFRGTNVLLEHFSGLLDGARAVRDGVEFERRLGISGFFSTKTIHYCGEIRTIIGKYEGQNVSAAEVWPFLRVLHVLSLDLTSATRQTEAAIKSLLAHTTREPDSVAAAEESWNALLREVGDGIPQARSFRRNDLTEALRQRHSPVGVPEQRAIHALKDHTTLILGGIRSTIGNSLHLVRGHLVQQVIGNLESTQVVVVSGAAGSGKSSVAKDAISILAIDHFVFSFRAEEFEHPHFDETLQKSQVPVNAVMLSAILAGQVRKVMLVESVERLLEASTRDAFCDLLTLLSKDRSWRLVLTCRDYSADLVRTCFLESASVGHSVVTIPHLDEAELKEVEAAFPTMARPLADMTLRRLLRNPYVLDKALQIQWSEERSLPQSEREFRELFWREIIRVDNHVADGMPRRREDAFVQIALRRARSLSLYTACGDLDAKVVDVLRRDSLIVSSRQSGVLMAPAHDVLEDWAILHWIHEQFATHAGSPHNFSAALETHPAVRRTYRKWVSELVEREPGVADGLFQTAIREVGLPAHFRDDTLVSLLRSPSSAAFLERHRAELFANGKELLRRVIQLLRVACVTTPAWLKAFEVHGFLFSVPDGQAWACVLRLVKDNLGLFTEGDCPLLLGFIEDWARGVSWQCPYPEGAESVAGIANWLLPTFDDFRSNDQRKRTLKVIAKIPNSNREQFALLLKGKRDGKKRDRLTDDFREIIFEGLEGMASARDLPKLVVSAAMDYLLCSEADLQRRRGYGSDLELETLFGIKQGRSHSYFPASGYRGPFLSLLRNHPSEGVAFIISVFNQSADWYAHPRVRSEYVESPFEMTLTFQDGMSRTQWCNGRLWLLYRGMSVGPYVLQSILMALELWLLEFAEAHPGELDKTLLMILKESKSVALTAVVASVATYSPHSAGETLLTLLRSPLCVQLDRRRLAGESQAPSKMLGLMPRLDASNKIYEEERKEADGLPHRRHDLETAITNLQLGPLAPRVHEILDQLRAEMPPVENQQAQDRIWRLAMHRMDLRQYTIAKDPDEGLVASKDSMPTENGKQYVRLDLNTPEPDVKDMVDLNATEFQAMNARLGLQMWGLKVYGREKDPAYDPGQWRQRLQEARITSFGSGNDLGDGGTGYVAAVCVRDHWDEMVGDERDWCVDVICKEVERQDTWDQFARIQRNSMSGDRPCAWVVPLLIGKSLDSTQQTRVRHILVIALTHAIKEVRWYAAWGISANLWMIDRELALRCVNTLATEATMVQQNVDKEYNRPRSKSEPWQASPERREVDEIEREVASIVRQKFFEADGISIDAYETFDPARWFGAEANGPILAILSQVPAEPVSILAFERLAHTLTRWWDSDVSRRRDQFSDRHERNHDTESSLTHLLHNFLLRTPITAATAILQPILGAVDQHTREIRWLILGLISVEDSQPNTQQFWLLWQLFAEKIRTASWLAQIDDEHSHGRDVMSAIFLGTWWKENARHWRSLEGHVGHVHSLFEDLPVSSTILNDYIRFLYYVGERSLPEAFIRIEKRMRLGDPVQMLQEGDTVFLLEVLLRRFVYGRPSELKSHEELRFAVLGLLDILVENGSSAAFRMRDDFVTPLVQSE